jgi:hypothetical protein
MADGSDSSFCPMVVFGIYGVDAQSFISREILQKYFINIFV